MKITDIPQDMEPRVGDIIEIEQGEDCFEVRIIGITADGYLCEQDNVQGAVLIESVGLNEDDAEDIENFLRSGGSIQQLPYKGSRKERFGQRNMASRHIGGGSGEQRKGKLAGLRGKAANVSRPGVDKKPVVTAGYDPDLEEGLRDPKDNPCWKGYHPVGTKQKNGRTVPNCVPNAKEGVEEAGPFSYGAKKPRRGSVAYNAMMKRREQEKNRPPIEPKDQMVGTAKLTKDVSETSDYFRRREREEAIISGQKPARKKQPAQTSDYARRREQEKKAEKGVAEGYTGRETKDGVWRVFKDGKAVAVAGPFKTREEAAAWIKKQKQGVAEGSGKNVVKSVKVGNFRHDLVDTGMGWQVRIYNGDELYDTGLSKNSEQKGLAALEDAVAYTEKQTRTKRQGVSEYGTHPSQRVDPRTGKKYVPPKSPLGKGVAEGLNEFAPGGGDDDGDGDSRDIDPLREKIYTLLIKKLANVDADPQEIAMAAMEVADDVASESEFVDFNQLPMWVEIVLDKVQGVAEGAKWRKHPDAYDVDDEGNKTPRNPNSSKFGYDPLQRRADTANDTKTPRGKTAALKTSLKMAKGQKGVAESGLQYHTGVKKHGEEYMRRAAEAGRKGASQEELGRLRDRYSKAYKKDVKEEQLDEYTFADKKTYMKFLAAKVQKYGVQALKPEERAELIAYLQAQKMTQEQEDWGSMSKREFKRRELEHELGHEVDRPRARSKGMWFYNVPQLDLFKAKAMGLRQSRSGKWYSTSPNPRADQAFGPGRYWEPKNEGMTEAEYQGRKVPLGKPMAGDVKKSKVYVRKPNGKVVKVNFGDKTMKIKKSNPNRRKSFRARHNCQNPGPRWKARYWSCRAW